MDRKTRENIELFIEIAEKVKDARFMRQPNSLSFNLSVGTGQSLKQELSGFDEEDLRSMLMDLRKFTLEKDGVHVRDVCKSLIMGSKQQETIDRLEECRSIYEDLMKSPAIIMTIDDKVEEGWDLLRKWFYGHYLHEEREKRIDLNNLGIGRPVNRYNFVLTVYQFAMLCIIIANNAKLVLAEN